MIGIVKMPIGNLQSVWSALYENGLDPAWVDPATDEGDEDLTHLIVPGVGNLRSVTEDLEASGLSGKIKRFAASGRPVLGICVGMQVLASRGTEGGGAVGLDLVPGVVDRLPVPAGVRLPHVGWNTLDLKRPHPVFDKIKPSRDFYFVHSFAFAADRADDVLGETDYGVRFTSVVARGNVVGVQFHPEKSQANGLRLLENFCDWDGRC